MEIIYAIYKENIIPLVGGVNPEGIEIGLAEYKGWKLCAMQENEFVKFSEFKLYPVSKSIAVGLMLTTRGTAPLTPDTGAPAAPGQIPAEAKEAFAKLTDEQEKLVEMSKEYIDKLDLKFITRAKIRAFKDFEDDLSDTKLLVEFLLGYIAEDFSFKTEEEKNAYPIKDLMVSFVNSLEGKDLRINNEKIITKVAKVIKDESLISRIVKSNYVDKLKTIG